jgi:hypothetical protein
MYRRSLGDLHNAIDQRAWLFAGNNAGPNPKDKTRFFALFNPCFGKSLFERADGLLAPQAGQHRPRKLGAST